MKLQAWVNKYIYVRCGNVMSSSMMVTAPVDQQYLTIGLLHANNQGCVGMHLMCDLLSNQQNTKVANGHLSL
jgi:hypothetical protein